MDTKTIIETAEEHLIHTYNRYQIVLDKGDGVHLYDTDGKEYLDFGAGIAVFALGYNNKEYNDALKAQIDKLVHTSNYFYNEPAAKAAKMLTKATGMDRVFFTNSGTEAVEGAIKLAKKYAYLKDGSTDHEIIAMEHSFHGRSMGALAVTGNKHYQEAFGPMIPGIRFAQYNNLESVKELVNEKTCAIIFETVQGEGGVYPAKKEFIEGVRKLCDKYGILMICDEVMAGFFRTGKWFAWQNFDFVPDMITFAKGVTCGYVQLGGCIVSKKVAEYFEENVLQCGLTYSGHTLACAAGVAAMKYYKEHDIEGHVAEMHEIVATFMDEMVKKHKCIGEARCIGLFGALEVVKNKETREPMQEYGVPGPVMPWIFAELKKRGFATFGRENFIEICPPLIITKEELEEYLPILDEVLTMVDEKFCD